MNVRLVAMFVVGALALAAGAAWVAAGSAPVPDPAQAASVAASATPAHAVVRSDAPDARDAVFHPPALSSIPHDHFGAMVKLGQRIFENPAKYAPQYVGNRLRCSNCHLDAGRLSGSAPMWAAYVSYPAYRSKNHKVNTFQNRLQGCFRYSMNGAAPPLGSKTLVALESYSYWMARGAPLDPKIAGRGYPKVPRPAQSPDYHRGQAVYEKHCALCHGAHGQGRRDMAGNAAFPALWGPGSFNWGAGMGSLKNAVPFIKANMPLSEGGTLSVQDAWDVALFMDSHERPQDPRFTGSVAETRKKFHDSSNSMYGKSVNGHVLGQGSVPSGGHLPSRDKGAQ